MSLTNSNRMAADNNVENKFTKTALVVDDNLSNRVIMGAYLEQMGYSLIEAANGQEAVDIFSECIKKPDVILMDVQMPVMDGYQATQRIKQLTSDEYIPIIFVTGLSDKFTLQSCIENGGDDYISKPVNSEIFKSKILAHQRIHELQSKVAHMYSEMLANQNLAKGIYEKMLQVNNQRFDGVHKVFTPSDVFSGDMMLTAYTPSRDIIIALVDFTGHGMSAAIGALPVSMLFRQYCAQGLHIRDIIQKLNKALYTLLPTEMFMAAQFIRIHHQLGSALVYNFAMPEIFIITDKTNNVRQRLASKGMALGIMKTCDPKEAEYEVKLALNDRILLFTDGITEFESTQGEEFCEDKLVDIIESNKEGNHSDAIYQKLTESNLVEKQHDDISLLEIKCSAGLLPGWGTEVLLGRTSEEEFTNNIDNIDNAETIFKLDFTLYGEQLVLLDPVPLLSTLLRSYEPVKPHKQALFAIIQDLFHHALNHSLADKVKINLSDIKKDTNLDCLHGEFIRFNLKILKVNDKKQFHITACDSGSGFDASTLQSVIENKYDVPELYQGLSRTITVCQKIKFEEKGTKVTAIYEWGQVL
ncbi:hypothetical protein MNBD_GAMMA12-1921 [hydrothermal vent metagenome]|uniref:Response regulatory domain-containing protein n=1 Tax=hydrothermal vent metagenome TaxID=652676 RepID=A0A3B0YHA6_9ZZZZ